MTSSLRTKLCGVLSSAALVLALVGCNGGGGGGTTQTRPPRPREAPPPPSMSPR